MGTLPTGHHFTALTVCGGKKNGQWIFANFISSAHKPCSLTVVNINDTTTNKKNGSSVKISRAKFQNDRYISYYFI